MQGPLSCSHSPVSWHSPRPSDRVFEPSLVVRDECTSLRLCCSSGLHSLLSATLLRLISLKCNFSEKLQIIEYEKKQTLGQNDTGFSCDGTANTFRVMFKEPIEILPNVCYTACATLKVRVFEYVLGGKLVGFFSRYRECVLHRNCESRTLKAFRKRGKKEAGS